jgi:co-chaperonin GroES (HSP10)
MSSKLKAVSGHVIVSLKAAESTTSNGLVIPENFRKNSTEAVVVDSAYEGVEKGDTVLLSGEWAGSGFTVGGVEYVAVIAEEILAVLE